MAISEFIPIGLRRSEVAGKIYSDSHSDLTGSVMLMCLKPLLLGIWVSDKEQPISTLSLHAYDGHVARIQGNTEKCLEVSDGYFCLWRPEKTSLMRISLKQRWFELPLIFRQSRKSKFRFSYAEVEHLTAAYFYPRRIFIVVVAHQDYLNVFPMDLHMMKSDSRDYVFSLQGSNLAEAQIRKVNRVLVCEIGVESLKLAYSLGKNHGRTNLTKDELPFTLGKSQHFGLPLPDFAIGYKEVEIDQHVALKSHTIFLGNVAYENAVPLNSDQPYHIHRFCHPYRNLRGELKDRLL